MTTYQHVKSTLEDLEQRMLKKLENKYSQIPATVPTGAANGYTQFFSCENVTQESPVDQDCIVICGVGINYYQGAPHRAYPDIKPWLYTYTGGNSWVEDYAPRMRQALDKNIATYQMNSAGWHANGYASSPNLLRHLNPAKKNPYILIATNMSPFLTQRRWAEHSNSDQNAILNLLGPNDHLCPLIQALGHKIDLWVVHGKQEVWPRFDNNSCPGGFSNWMLTHNLSGLGMRWISSFWKTPFIQSARPPFFPICPDLCVPAAALDFPVDE